MPAKFPPLPTPEANERYGIIYADPPWDYKGQLQHAGPGSGDSGGAVRHYPTVQLGDLMELDVASIAAADSLLFMWATSPHLDQAIDLGKAWGFAWATVAFVWDKQRVNPGFYTMSQCELCLVLKRGKIPAPRGARNVRQLVSERRSEHSRKPIEIRHRIEAMFPRQRKIELFARDGDVHGWDTWGADVPHPQTERAFHTHSRHSQSTPRHSQATHRQSQAPLRHSRAGGNLAPTGLESKKP